MVLKLLSIFFNVSLIVFTVASTILALYSINNRLRLRHIRMSWRTGKLNGFPLFASLFLFFLVTLACSMLIIGNDTRLPTLASYIWMSFMWFISSYLASKHYITDNGIVKNINEPSQTIPWYLIIDYAEQEEEDVARYSFVYRENSEDTSIYRLQLLVPEKQVETFKKIVSYKLEKRFKNDIPIQLELKEKKDNKDN